MCKWKELVGQNKWLHRQLFADSIQQGYDFEQRLPERLLKLKDLKLKRKDNNNSYNFYNTSSLIKTTILLY